MITSNEFKDNGKQEAKLTIDGDKNAQVKPKVRPRRHYLGGWERGIPLTKCKVCDKEIGIDKEDGDIEEYSKHMEKEHPIPIRCYIDRFYFEDSKHRRIYVYKTRYGTLCWNYIDEYDAEIDENELKEVSPKLLSNIIKSDGWMYIKSYRIEDPF